MVSIPEDAEICDHAVRVTSGVMGPMPCLVELDARCARAEKNRRRLKHLAS